MNHTTHYSVRSCLWLTFRVALALSVAMGIGRFAFTPLLPMMLHDGAINLAQGGWLATSNYLGYFVGALLCMFVKTPPVPTIRTGLIATIVLTAGMGLIDSLLPATQSAYTVWLILRGAAGVASAFVFIFSSGWCLHRLAEMGHAKLGGVIYCGPGIGIAFTGLLATALVAHGWHANSGWLAFSAIALVLTALSWQAFSDSPIQPSLTHTQAAVKDKAPHSPVKKIIAHDTWLLILAYGSAGFGYIITATFLPVIARQALPGSMLVDLFWPLFGICVAIGALLSITTPTYWDNRTLLTICVLTQSCAVLTGLVWPSAWGLALSSIFLGLPFTALTLYAMRECRELRAMEARLLMAAMTAAYGLGQIAGPPLATWLVTISNSFTPSLIIASMVLLAGALSFLWLRLKHHPATKARA